MLRVLNTFTNSDSIKEGGDSVKWNGSISPQMVEDVVKTPAALCAALNWTPRRGPALCVLKLVGSLTWLLGGCVGINRK